MADYTSKFTGEQIDDLLSEMESQSFMPATPSGDPMHYAYVNAGAVWNGTAWQLNGINDLTNADMRAIYELGNSRIYRGASLIDYFVGNSVRTNIPAKMSLSGVGLNINYMATDQWLQLEVIQFAASGSVKMEASGLDYCFAGCQELRAINNPLDFSNVTTCYDSVFSGCSALTTLQITGLKCNLNVKDCPLSVASATYIIANASSSATFSVTFKASMQAAYEANTDFLAAKNAKPNITINYL